MRIASKYSLAWFQTKNAIQNHKPIDNSKEQLRTKE